MKKTLLDVIFASDKRKRTLLLLQDGPKEIEFFLSSLNTTRQALLPQIRILENHYLIRHSHDVYELTTIGKLIVDEMIPLLDIIEVADSDIDYWGTHNLDFIPSHLYKRLSELGPCTVITNPPSTEVYEPSKQAVESAKKSAFQVSVTTFLFPSFPSLLEDFKKYGVNMSLVVSTELFAKINEEQNEHLRNLLKNDLNKVYIYPKRMDFVAFGYNEFSFMMRLLTKEGNYDHKYVSSCNPSALIWAKELFEYYLKDAIPITGI
jgi:predicted transcriptional regulator